ncbi:MAG: hypothetical protein ACK52I_19760 [Pseudomonadota bacterium]|uniref:hypothetical protein n=1 Tax=Silanimonas sp. TaxID=1929290 RepID=UPI0022BF4E0F|nr:hypothetical protein [Silanimonas sp.]MCZ8114165.1 hypothetical protein [Silanimonas sp.]
MTTTLPSRDLLRMPNTLVDGNGGAAFRQQEVCAELRFELIPAIMRDWCSEDKSEEELLAAASEKLISIIGGTPGYGSQSGLGMLHDFLRMPASRISVPGRGDSASVALRGLSEFIVGARSWSSFSDEMARACFIPQIAETGRAHNGNGYFNPATAQCLRAVAVIRMEASGAPFNAERDATWLDGVSLGVGAGVTLSADLGRWLSEALEAGGFKNGLKAGNSLHMFEYLVGEQVSVCNNALKRLKSRGCKP